MKLLRKILVVVMIGVFGGGDMYASAIDIGRDDTLTIISELEVLQPFTEAALSYNGSEINAHVVTIGTQRFLRLPAPGFGLHCAAYALGILNPFIHPVVRQHAPNGGVWIEDMAFWQAMADYEGWDIEVYLQPHITIPILTPLVRVQTSYRIDRATIPTRRIMLYVPPGGGMGHYTPLIEPTDVRRLRFHVDLSVSLRGFIGAPLFKHGEGVERIDLAKYREIGKSEHEKVKNCPRQLFESNILIASGKNDIATLKQYLEKLYNDDDTKGMYKEKSEIEAVISTINALIQLAQNSGISSSSLLSSSSPSHSSDSSSSGSALFKFKIGFEFQEENNLCSWAYDDLEIQKEEIFSAISTKGEKLWHLEIDGKDIEFVTEPFANDDIPRLLSCIESIELACDTLAGIASEKRKYELQTSFTDWIEGASPEPKRLAVLKSRIGNVTDLDAKAKVEAEIDKLEKEVRHIDGIQRRLSEIGLVIQIHNQAIYDKIKNNPIQISTIWKPTFVPHVTIQHSLKDSIPLIISLFSSITDINSLSTIEQNILFSLPYRNMIKANVLYFSTNEYLTEENGLLFLHALTCAGIPKEKDSTKAFDVIQQNFLRGQVDPKISLYFLCRRPFSSMWADVKKIKESLVFYNLYNQRIIEGNSFFQRIIVPNFQFINYAEEYYSGTPPIRVNFSSVLCPEYPHSLFGKGIVSTSLIRHLRPTIFDGYLNKVIISVDNPGIKHLILDHAKFPEIITTEIDKHTDLLSPPCFLELDNSMGAYTNEKLYRQHFDPSYGAAILEMRFIRFISTEALSRMRITQRSGQFLTRKANSLKDDVIGLLSILNYEFIHEKYKQEIFKMTTIKDEESS